MSFAEVLAAARELTADERRELARELSELPEDGIPDHLQHLIPPPGTEVPYWKPELTTKGWEQVQTMLAEMKGTV